MDRAPPVRDNNGPASMVEQEGRVRGGTVSGGTAGGGKVRLGDNSAPQPGPLHRGLGYESPRVFLFFPHLRFAPTHPSPGNSDNKNSSSQQQSVRFVVAIRMVCWGFFAL